MLFLHLEVRLICFQAMRQTGPRYVCRLTYLVLFYPWTVGGII